MSTTTVVPAGEFENKCAHLRVEYRVSASVPLNGSWECTICGTEFNPSPQPAPDAGGEWRVLTYDKFVIVRSADAQVVARCSTPEYAARIVRDHNAALASTQEKQ